MLRSKFKRKHNSLESSDKAMKHHSPDVPSEMCTTCPSCKAMLFTSELAEQNNLCNKCGHHFRLNARQRIHMLCDSDSFIEHDNGVAPSDPLGFPGYDEKLRAAELASHEREAVITGTGRINGFDSALFVMDSTFMMGSMGTAVGEKITRIFEHATELGLPVIGYCVSGGARMQEGIFSLMQMAKISGAVARHSNAGLLYVAVLTDPTTGGVTASFAMEGDIIIAEPGALIGFAGPRVIEQTIRQKLPKGFQRAEFLLEHGFLDEVVPRDNHRTFLSQLLSLHGVTSCDTEGGAE